jgi:hypothetical protein
MTKTKKWFLHWLFLGVFSVLLIFGTACKVQAAQSDDPKTWERIPRQGYADNVEYGNYAYYFENEVNTSKYKIYRQDLESGKQKCILTYTRKNDYGIGITFYTNGEKLVCVDTNLIYCSNADGTGSQKKVLDLKKKGDGLEALSAVSVYGDKIYYSTYHIYDMYYKSYSIRITGKAKKVISKTYAVNGSSDRYIPMFNEKGGMAVYDAVTGKVRTLYKSGEGDKARVGDYWYYIVCQNPNATAPKMTLYRKSASGKGSAKKLAEFSRKNVNLASVMEITEEGIYFAESDKIKLYSLKDKKVKKTDRDIWYYVAKNMAYH